MGDIKHYTKDILKECIINYYIEFDEIPTDKSMLAVGYPAGSTFHKYFGSWNAALEYAGLEPRKYTDLSNKPNVCEICEATKTNQWCDRNGLKVCDKCYRSDRKYINGNLNPNSTVGMGVITEHIVYTILNDCIKCNIVNSFNSQYDLISKKYGTINVKSSKLRKQNSWCFHKRQSGSTPDYYICLGFDEDKTKILKVFIIPGNSDLIAKRSITISNNNSDRTKQYEVDPKPYNDLYKSLDISTLPEFSNYNTHEYITPTNYNTIHI